MKSSMELVKELREKNPALKAIRIAEIIGVTRERVRQILNQLGLPTNFRVVSPCPGCGKEGRNYPVGKMCEDCRYQSNRVDLVCDGCGCLFKRHKRRAAMTFLHYHSDLCRLQNQGAHAAGRGSRPKWNMTQMAEQRKSGMSIQEIATFHGSSYVETSKVLLRWRKKQGRTGTIGF